MSEFRGSEQGDPLAMLQALLETPSVNPSLEAGGSGEAAVAELTAAWLRSWGFDVDIREPHPGRSSVVARHGAGSPTLLLNGHLDTVGVAGMTVPPFDGTLRDGRIRGRGACDMKGGLAALLGAARSLAEAGHPGSLIVALTADEEHASLGMADLVASGIRADAGVVCEPTGLAVMPAHKGFVWVEAVFHGRAAHGSRPEVGIDAIRHAGRFLAALDDLDGELGRRPPHPLLGSGSIHAGTIAGGAAPSVYPERCTVLLERRTLPGERAERVIEELEGLAAALGARHPTLKVDFRVTLERPGTEVAPEHPLVEGLLEAAARAGVDPAIEPMTAWVDAAFLNEAGIPSVCFGPGSIEQAHAADEWIDAEEVPRCATILTDFAHRFLAGGGSESRG